MEKLNRLYMIRHGQVNGFADYPAYGHTDVDITEVGRLQMENIAERLRHADLKAIYSSDLKRSVKGAQIIARYHDVRIHSLPELREVFFGDWEAVSFKEIHERFPDDLKKRMANIENFQPPGNGESMGQLSDRIMTCFRDILEEQRGKDFLFVGHGAVNRIILCDAMGLSIGKAFNLQQDYGCLNIIDYYEDSTRVVMMNG